jgi:hypothetical protein
MGEEAMASARLRASSDAPLTLMSSSIAIGISNVSVT